MTEPLSNTTAAVLGMVVLGARSGYEVRRGVERSVRFFWALGPPQIYAELKRLERDGLVEGRDDTRGARPRRTYEATAAGRAALRAWVGEGGPAAPLELRDPELLRLFFAEADAAVALAAAMRRRSEQAVERFVAEIEPAAARAGHDRPALVARFGRELHEFIAERMARLEAELARPPER